MKFDSMSETKHRDENKDSINIKWRWNLDPKESNKLTIDFLGKEENIKELKDFFWKSSGVKNPDGWHKKYKSEIDKMRFLRDLFSEICANMEDSDITDIALNERKE